VLRSFGGGGAPGVILSQSDCVDLLSMPSDTEAASREVTSTGQTPAAYYDMHVAPFANVADTVAGRQSPSMTYGEKELQAP
jgi:hypothetical protein